MGRAANESMATLRRWRIGTVILKRYLVSNLGPHGMHQHCRDTRLTKKEYENSWRTLKRKKQQPNKICTFGYRTCLLPMAKVCEFLMWTGTNKVEKQRNNKCIWPILLTVLLGKHCWHVQVRSQKQGRFCEITWTDGKERSKETSVTVLSWSTSESQIEEQRVAR